jgi:hypothetical protein
MLAFGIVYRRLLIVVKSITLLFSSVLKNKNGVACAWPSDLKLQTICSTKMQRSRQVSTTFFACLGWISGKRFVQLKILSGKT